LRRVGGVYWALVNAAGFNWLFRRRLWFCLDVAHHKLVGYRSAPPATTTTTTTTNRCDATSRSASVSPPWRDATPVKMPQSTVSIDLRAAGIYTNPTEKHQFTIA